MLPLESNGSDIDRMQPLELKKISKNGDRLEVIFLNISFFESLPRVLPSPKVKIFFVDVRGGFTVLNGIFPARPVGYEGVCTKIHATGLTGGR